MPGRSNPSTDTVIAADNFDGRLFLINGSTGAVTTRERTLLYSNSLTVDPATNIVYATDFDYSMSDIGGVISGPGRADGIPIGGGGAVGASVPIPASDGSFGAIADDSAVQRAFESFDSSVWIFSTSANTFTGHLPVSGADQLAVDQSTGVIYVSSTSGVTVITPESIIYRSGAAASGAGG